MKSGELQRRKYCKWALFKEALSKVIETQSSFIKWLILTEGEILWLGSILKKRVVEGLKNFSLLA